MQSKRYETSVEAMRQTWRHREGPITSASSGRHLVAHCDLGLGKLYRRTDQREQAQVHLTTATTMYREMGMTYWLQKAEMDLG